jgi:hypothetical protein
LFIPDFFAENVFACLVTFDDVVALIDWIVDLKAYSNVISVYHHKRSVYSCLTNCIGGVMVSVLSSSATRNTTLSEQFQNVIVKS